MTVEPGMRLGPYEIIEPLGAGGMGEVYLAKDTRLDRTVAIKVLPGHMSANPEFRQRFEREARAISSLTHPHICSLYDVGHESGVDYLVMEHLEGDTLAHRLTAGPLPLEDVLRFGREIAAALSAAHRKGVVHRDLKPGNVMITPTGVKLLDFGLAKMGELAAAPESSLTMKAQTEPPNTPLTAQGTILGTYQYMAPEQLEGEEADARTDIFAFGAVLYEMLTGRRAFEGKSQASLVASIMSANPTPISQLLPMTPPALDRLVRTCLKKDPNERWQTAHDVALQLEWIAEGGSAAGLPAPVTHRRRARERVAWGLTAALGAALVAMVAWFALNRPEEQLHRPLRYQVPAPPGIADMDAPKLSPDGRYMAFNADDSTGTSRIWIQPLNALTAHPLPGTEDARRPIWSPDSRSVAFFVNSRLFRVDIAGGPTQLLCEARGGADGTWSPEGIILFDGTSGDSIRWVPDTGGLPQAATVLNRSEGEMTHAWPYFLPDGKHFLFQVQYGGNEKNTIKIGELGSFETRTLEETSSRMEYVPQGYILWVQNRTLLARRFDPGSQRFTGEPFPVLESIGASAMGLARFSTSRNGILAYRESEGTSRRLYWTDRNGTRLEAIGELGGYGNPALSPDGKRLLVDQLDPRTGSRDIWILDLDRGTTSRVTLDPADDHSGVWSPDGRRIAFSSDRSGKTDIYVKSVDGAGTASVAYESPYYKELGGWSPDGKYLVLNTRSESTQWDILAVPMTGGDTVRVAGQPYDEGWPVFSPDGRWIAYNGSETGRNQVYVQAFPEPSGRWQVSVDGGDEMYWTRDGREICYVDRRGRIMAADVGPSGSGLKVGTPHPLFTSGVSSDNGTRNRFCPSADGEHFVVVALDDAATLKPTIIMVDWDEELQRRR